MTEALKPCPFCGGEAEFEKRRVFWQFRVRCNRCGIGTDWLGQVMDCPTHPVTRLIDRWNSRAPAGLAALAAHEQGEGEGE